MPDELHVSTQVRGGWKTAVAIMPTSQTCRSVWHCNAAGEAVAAAVLHEVLSALCQLHRLGFLHADVKPDNFLLVEGVKGGKQDLPIPFRVMALDLGRAVDVDKEPVSFVSKNHIKPFRCPEMESAEPWLYQIDAYGAACIAFGILFGTWFNMKVEKDEHDGIAFYRLKRAVPKTMDEQLWHRTFGVLLNGTVKGSTAGKDFSIERLGDLREGLSELVTEKRVETTKILTKLLQGKDIC
jgi:hypothetical protein